jgi:hypothetical protein
MRQSKSKCEASTLPRQPTRPSTVAAKYTRRVASPYSGVIPSETLALCRSGGTHSWAGSSGGIGSVDFATSSASLVADAGMPLASSSHSSISSELAPACTMRNMLRLLSQLHFASAEDDSTARSREARGETRSRSRAGGVRSAGDSPDDAHRAGEVGGPHEACRCKLHPGAAHSPGGRPREPTKARRTSCAANRTPKSVRPRLARARAPRSAR